jgi:hypothetical protein
MNQQEALQNHPNRRKIIAEYNKNIEDNNRIIPKPPEVPELVPVEDEIPENNLSKWFNQSQFINETEIRTGEIFEFQRVTQIGFPYQHWAIYIGPFTYKTENGEIIKCRNAMSHLLGKSKDVSAHMGAEGYPRILPEHRAPSLGYLEEEIENSHAWRTNNTDLPGVQKLP